MSAPSIFEIDVFGSNITDTARLHDNLVGMSIARGVSLDECIILGVYGYKSKDPYQHENVLVMFRRGVETCYLRIDRDWKSTESSDASQTPTPQSTSSKNAKKTLLAVGSGNQVPADDTAQDTRLS
ncbi:hypothetical protein C0995_011979 [Termitomyces sp. Mi166|nr:hypothetical protein C0995_011979 [Termitomyces sp. Mi166\